MKKTLFIFLSVISTLTITMSCSDDDDNNVSFATTPEKEAAGVYSGTFAREQEGAAVPEISYSEGTMTIEPENEYVATIKYECAEFSINHSSIANISHSDYGFAFSNNLVTNTLGAPFFGRIDESANVESHLKLKIRSGRKTKTYNIVFKGKRIGTLDNKD